MSGAYQVQCVLQFLKENGWTNTFECLELESGISFDETLVEAPNTLSAALIAAHVEGQEVGGMVPLDDDLLHQADGLYCRELVATHPTFHTKSALCVRFNKDGRWLASGSSDKAVRIATTIQNPDSTVKHTITPHTAGVLDLDWNPINEKLLLTSSMDRSHVVTNIDTILNQSPEQSTATALLHGKKFLFSLCPLRVVSDCICRFFVFFLFYSEGQFGISLNFVTAQFRRPSAAPSVSRSHQVCESRAVEPGRTILCDNQS
eukprot:c13654_g1_i2.p1 GENE.c13654_g1_i2~~c13654_g1_i2.p1  ORF type:complete len:276 (+),score=53.37 c13654_g1_i2:47-829(+)